MNRPRLWLTREVAVFIGDVHRAGEFIANIRSRLLQLGGYKHRVRINMDEELAQIVGNAYPEAAMCLDQYMAVRDLIIGDPTLDPLQTIKQVYEMWLAFDRESWPEWHVTWSTLLAKARALNKPAAKLRIELDLFHLSLLEACQR